MLNNDASKSRLKIIPIGFKFRIVRTYNAGACFPLQLPSGWRGQLAPVIEAMEEKDCPQYLQVY